MKLKTFHEVKEILGYSQSTLIQDMTWYWKQMGIQYESGIREWQSKHNYYLVPKLLIKKRYEILRRRTDMNKFRLKQMKKVIKLKK